MTALSDEGIKADESNFGSVRTGSSTFSNGKPAKAATERTGGENILSSENEKTRFNQSSLEKKFRNTGEWRYLSSKKKTVVKNQDEAATSKPGFFRRIHHFYEREVLSEVRHIRGAVKLTKVLSNIADLVGDHPERTTAKPMGIDDFEWENLIILDACRQDLYEEVTGHTTSRISKGSHSADFVRKSFSEGNYDDVVVITANPHYSKKIFKRETGREPDDVFHTVFHSYKDRWDSDENTVLPGDLAKDVETASKLFPEKRLLIHFMQPHNPFIGSEFNSGGFDHLFTDNECPGFWEIAVEKDLSKQEIFKPYAENLELVLDVVKDLEEVLSGRTVITSDHGNLVGENGFYGHPKGKDYKALRKVPFEVRNL